MCVDKLGALISSFDNNNNLNNLLIPFAKQQFDATQIMDFPCRGEKVIVRNLSATHLWIVIQRSIDTKRKHQRNAIFNPAVAECEWQILMYVQSKCRLAVLQKLFLRLVK